MQECPKCQRKIVNVCRSCPRIGENNPNFGNRHTQKTLTKMSKIKQGKNNPMWRGDKVGFSALHEWIKNRLPKPKLCQDCKKVKPMDLANISGQYKRELSDWEWLCRRCHMIKDGRLKKLHKSNIKL